MPQKAKPTNQLFGREVLVLPREEQLRRVQTAFRYWRRTGFPYATLEQQDIELELIRLNRSPLPPRGELQRIGSSTVGLRLANHYHPQMWHARSHRHSRSPYQYFHNDDALCRMLERAPRFWPNRRCWSAQAVRNLVRIYAGGRVANFRPVVARQIVSAFSREGDTVLDFSSGYGGRFLACASLRRPYIGIDPAVKQVEGAKAMRRDLRRFIAVDAQFVCGCAEDVLPERETRSVDLIFSSPPFFNIEIYSDEPTQSSHRYSTYSLWRTAFLHAVIEESWRVLRRGGVFAVHTPPEHVHSPGADAMDFASRYFAFHRRVEVEMPARPLQRAGNGQASRVEPIIVFRKR